MDTTALTVFTGVVALALLIQSLALYGILRSIRGVAERVELHGGDLRKSISAVLDSLNELLLTIKQIAQDIQAVQKQISSTSDIIHKRIVVIDSFLEETTDSARLQMARVQDVLDTSAKKLTQTFDLVHRGIVAPVNEATAVLRGIRAALNFFLFGRKTPAHQSHQDEEMFI